VTWAWGLQFHIECDAEMIGDWAATNTKVLADLGTDAATLVEECAAVLDDIQDVWQPFAPPVRRRRPRRA